MQDSAIPVPGRVTITARELDDTTVITVSGELDATVVDDLRQHLTTGLNSAAAMIVDLTVVTFCSVAILRALLDTKVAARSAAVPCAIVSNHRTVLRAIIVNGLWSELTLHRTLDAAMDSLSDDAPTAILAA
ncbi:STAS domain-containing protein [Amycolatopsis sp. NPDC004378]